MDEHKSQIEKLQQKIDSQNFHPKENLFELHKKEYTIRNNWGDEQEATPKLNFNPGSNAEPEEKGGNRFFKFIFGFAILFFVASIAYGALIFIRDNKNVVGEDVTINVVGPISIGGGEKLSLDILIQNNNAVPIELVDLIMDYPEGTKELDLSTDLKRSRESVGTIAAGSVVRRTVSSALFGSENSTKEITASVDYRVQGMSAIFSKQKKFDIVLSAAPIRIVVAGLKEVSSGQNLELDLKIISNSTKQLEKVAVSAEYPFGFTFKESSVNPVALNSFWVFDSLGPNEEKTIKIKGQILGQNAEDRVFKFKTGLLKTGGENQIGVIFNSATHELAIQKSFVDLTLSINDTQGSDFVIASAQDVIGYLSFANNTNDVIRNLNIELSLDGAVLNENSISAPDGFYSSVDNKIIWNSETSSNFSEIRPRDTFRLQFRFKTVDLKNSSAFITNPTIRLRAGVTGRRTSEDNKEEKIETIAAANLQVQSDVLVRVHSARDEEAFANFGPIPPKAEVESSYTVVFDISNNVNNLKNARIETVIPSYVIYKDIFYPKTAEISFDPVTRKLVWNIGDINTAVGYGRASKKLLLNVTIRPSISQIGSAPLLTNKSRFTALDTFTNKTIDIELQNATTKLYNDTGGINQGNVVQ